MAAGEREGFFDVIEVLLRQIVLAFPIRKLLLHFLAHLILAR